MEQIIIEPLKAKDLIFLNTVRNSCAAEYLHDPRTFDMEETIEWFKNLPPEHKYYLISIKDETGYFDNIPIGYFRCKYYGVPAVRCMEIGADLYEGARGKGYAYQAYTQFIRQLKEDGIEFLSLEVLADNRRAMMLYIKLGFEPIDWRLILRNGKYTPSLKMGMMIK